MAMFLNFRGPRQRQPTIIIAPTVVVAFTILPSIVGAGKIGAGLVLNLGVAPGATLTGILSRASGIIIASVSDGETYTPTAADDAATLTLTAKATIGTTSVVAAITKAITYNAPIFSVQPTLSPNIATSGAVFALTMGAASNAAVLSIEYFRLGGVTKADEILASMWNSTGESAGAITYRVRATNSGGFTLSDEVAGTLNAVGALIGPARTTAPTVAPNAPVKEGTAQTVTPGTYAVAVTITYSWQTNGTERAATTSYTPPTATYRDQVLTLVETAVQAGNPTPTVTTISLGPIYGLPTSAAGSLEFNVTADAAVSSPNLTPTASAITFNVDGPDHTQLESATLMTWAAGDLVIVNLHGRKTSNNAIAVSVTSLTVGTAARAFGTGTALTERGLTNAAGTVKSVYGMYAVRMATAGSGYLQVVWNMNAGAAAMENTAAYYWAIPNTHAATPVLEYVNIAQTATATSSITLSGAPARVGELLIGGFHTQGGGIGFAAATDGGVISDQGFTDPLNTGVHISLCYMWNIAEAADVTAATHKISATYTPSASSYGAALRIQPV